MNTIQIVYTATQKHIDEMNIGDRKTSKELIEAVVKETNINASMASGLVLSFIQDSPELTLKMGRTGGAVKVAKVELDRCETCNQILPFEEK